MGIFKKKEQPTKESKTTYEINAAIVAGKDVWRPVTEFMQWLPKTQTILENDIATLDEMLKSYIEKGGSVSYNEAQRMWTAEYSNIRVHIRFDHIGKVKYRAIEDENYNNTPKDIIKEIGLIISVHREYDKRRFALKVIKELIAYIDDDATKDSIQAILNKTDSSLETLFNAIRSEDSPFALSIDNIAEDTKT